MVEFMVTFLLFSTKVFYFAKWSPIKRVFTYLFICLLSFLFIYLIGEIIRLLLINTDKLFEGKTTNKQK